MELPGDKGSASQRLLRIASCNTAQTSHHMNAGRKVDNVGSDIGLCGERYLVNSTMFDRFRLKGAVGIALRDQTVDCFFTYGNTSLFQIGKQRARHLD